MIGLGWFKRAGFAFRRVAAIAGERFRQPANPAPITAAYTASSWERVPYDPSGGTFTITLPDEPADGDQVQIKNTTNDDTAITIDGSGNDVEDTTEAGIFASTTSLEGHFGVVVFQYDDENGEWTIVSIQNAGFGITSDRLGWNMAPTGNGVLNILGWYIQTDSGASLTSAAPVTPAEAGFHAHYVLDVSAASGLPFTVRITGTSIDEDTGATTGADTEDIAVAANGFCQTTKSWIDDAEISIVEGSKSATIDVFRTSYWDLGNKNFTINGVRVEWTPDVATWSIQVKIRHVQNDGSIVDIDDFTFANTDSPPRAANGDVGKHKRGDYDTDIAGASKEGLIVEVTQTNMENFLLEVKYHE